MKRRLSLYSATRRLMASAFFERASLFFAMYLVTVSLFWFETGVLSKGLLFGLIAASLKTAIARGHAKLFQPQCDPTPTVCDDCAAREEWDDEEDDDGPVTLPWPTAAPMARTCTS